LYRLQSRKQRQANPIVKHREKVRGRADRQGIIPRLVPTDCRAAGAYSRNACLCTWR